MSTVTPFKLPACLSNSALFLLLLMMLLHAQTISSQGITKNPDDKVKQQTGETVGRSYALVIGISDYKNIRPLNYADDDAYLFAKYLVDQKICDKKDVFRLIDSVATSAVIYKELSRLLDSLKKTDRLFFYFSGHGDVENKIQSGFLLTYNSEPNNYPAFAIDLDMLSKYMNAFSERGVEVIIITDACRSGNLAGGISGASATIRSLQNGFRQGVKILSCQPDQLSIEQDLPGGGHGIFTYHLVDALSGLCDVDDNGQIDLREIDRYMDTVRTITKKTQTPKVDGNPDKVLTRYNRDLKKALIAQKNGDSQAALVSPKNPYDTVWSNNSFFQQFLFQIRMHRLIAPGDNNAYKTYVDATIAKQAAVMLRYMQLELTVRLEDKAQKWISKYLRGELESNYAPIIAEITDAGEHLDTCIRLIDGNDLRANGIKVKRMFLEASGIYRKGKPDKYEYAISLINESMRLAPNQAWLYNLAGALYLKLHQYTAAITNLETAIRLSPTWPYPWNNLGIVYEKMRKQDSAYFAFSMSLSIDSNYSMGWNNLGALYMSQNKTELAANCYQKAIAIDPNYSFPWNGLGVVFMKQYQSDSAIQYLKQAITIDPRDNDPFINLGVQYMNLKLYDSAIRYYKRAYQLDSANAELLFNFGYLYWKQKKYDSAKYYYLANVKINPAFQDQWSELGSLYATLNKYDSAVFWYRKASIVDSLNSGIWYYLGNLYLKMKNYDSAGFYFQKILHQEPLDPFSYYNLARLYSLQGITQKAIENVENAILKGYRNFIDLETNADLQNIQNNKEFKRLVNKYRRKG